MNLVDLQFAKKSLAKVEKITLICNRYIQIRFSYRAASHLAPFVYITQFYITYKCSIKQKATLEYHFYSN